jgi:predicted  nucleic acid-binding Zn-ribbon protein
VNETENLRALMEADRWIDRVTAQRNHLPEMAELATVEEELRGLLTSLNEAQALLTPIRTSYEDAQRESGRLRTRADALDSTLSSSTANARELAALQNELVHVKELLARSEDLELDYLIELEPLEEVVNAVKAQAQPQVARRTQLQGDIASLQSGLDEELVSLREDRTQRASKLSGELLARYDAAFSRVGTSGAAQVDAGRCDGCRIALSPLDVDRWKGQAEGVFMPCPECGRLLLP